jgi:hypothetical protein
MDTHGLMAPIPWHTLTPEAESARVAVRAFGRRKRLLGYVNAKGKRTVQGELRGPASVEEPKVYRPRTVTPAELGGAPGQFARAAAAAGWAVHAGVVLDEAAMVVSVVVLVVHRDRDVKIRATWAHGKTQGARVRYGHGRDRAIGITEAKGML